MRSHSIKLLNAYTEWIYQTSSFTRISTPTHTQCKSDPKPVGERPSIAIRAECDYCFIEIRPKTTEFDFNMYLNLANKSSVHVPCLKGKLIKLDDHHSVIAL